nr:uncharacterized protein LOC109986352 [Labrus bergylta]
MAATAGRRRRRSKEHNPDLSEVKNTCADEEESREQRMRQIVVELKGISDGVRKMQERTDKARAVGALIGRSGFGLLILSALLIRDSSFLVAIALAVVTAGSGAAAVFVSNVTKTFKENTSLRKVEELGRELVKISESQKSNMEETTSRTELDAFHTRLSRVSEGRAVSVFEALTIRRAIQTLLMLMMNICKVTATPEEDQTFRESIAWSAEQSQRVIEEFIRIRQQEHTETDSTSPN